MNLAKFPRRGYVTEPTPLEALPNFSKALGADINIYIKRDDLLPGTAGGNKTRIRYSFPNLWQEVSIR